MSDEKGKSKRTRAVIDRVEDGGTAVVLAGEEELKVELPASLLPEGSESGSHIVISVSLDEASRKEAEGRVKSLQEKLEKRGGGEVKKSFKL